MTKFSYEEIVKSRKSKYDIAMKSFMLSQDSELRHLLELPAGDAFPAELPGYDGRATDTIVLGAQIHHVEFQTKDVDEMPWRMLEYYWLLYRNFSQDFKLDRYINQTLVYIGCDDDADKMKPPLVRDGLDFTYGYQDLRDLGAKSTIDLLRSKRPFDWILRVLCFRDVDRRIWENVALKVATHCSTNKHGSQNLKVHLLVAMALRNLDYHVARKLCDMLEVNMEKVPAFKEAIDNADYRGNVQGVAESIKDYVLTYVEFDNDEALSPLYEIPLDHLRALRSTCYAAADADSMLYAVSSKFAELGLRFR